MAQPTPPMTPRHDPYAPFRIANYRYYAFGWVLTVIGTQTQSVALQWEIYSRTDDPLALGLVGLVQLLPGLIFLLPAGHVADVFDRKRVMMAGLAATTVTSATLAWLSFSHAPIWSLYATLFIDATALAVARPARASMLPLIVPEAIFGNAVAWNSSMMQTALMVGPAIGGFVVAATPWLAYLLSAACTLVFVGMLTRVRPAPQQRSTEKPSLTSLLSGVRFVWRSKLVLSAIALDMFAVLLGGATYLLPIYARDILHVGEVGFGALRAAPAVGALLMAVTLAHLPPIRRAGPTLLWAVAGFGVATIVFGLSESFLLSLSMLALTGMLDNVSVVVRHTLVQLATPDAMRGRVSAVNSVFIGASNELGGFESGVVARLFGPVVSVVSGGIGTVVVVALTAWAAPPLRRLRELSAVRPEPVSPTASAPAAPPPG